jgi:hypothetical protein
VNGLLDLLKTEFKCGGNVPNLEEKASKHFVDHGLGTAACAHGPADSAEVVSTFKHHARFSDDNTRSEAKIRLRGCDDHVD